MSQCPEQMTVGRVLPRFITPDDVRALKARADPTVRSLDETVRTCAALPLASRENWNAFVKSWRAYFDEDVGWTDAWTQHDRGEVFEADIIRWQEMLAQHGCKLTAPRFSPSAPEEKTDPLNQWHSTIKTVAIASVVVALVFGLRTVVK